VKRNLQLEIFTTFRYYTEYQTKTTLSAQESAIIYGLSAKDCGLLPVIAKV